MTESGDGAKRCGLSPVVRALGIVSLLADVSSEMVYPLNPMFLTRVLGAPAWALGLIEGVAESTASLLKLYSGWLSDKIGARKPFVVAGYGFGALGKPMIALAGSWGHVLAARFVDRLGKGLRTAPRDALITENCDADRRGQAFGFHRSMDTIGAVGGPLLGYLLLSRFLHGTDAQNWRSLYWVAFVPGLLGVLVLAVMVKEKRTPADLVRKALPTITGLSPAYKRYLLICALFGLGNSSDTFLILRAQNDMGVRPEQVFLLYALFNVVEAALGYPVGRLSDRVGRKPLIALGWLVFAAVYLGFALLQGMAAACLLFVLYGFYYTLTQGVQRAMAADLAHADRRATEIGAFHMVVGLAALPASIGAGFLYELHRWAPFAVGACTAVAAAGLMLAVRLDKPESAPVS